jgi:acetolactate synthase I/III small subunit
VAAPERIGAAPPPAPTDVHTLSLYVSNKPGVLVRVALVFARRGFNIESLVVSPAAKGEFSRMTIVCSGERANLEQIVKQLKKLVDVVNAVDHTGDQAFETEIALVKLQADLDRRTQILQIAEHFGAKVVDYGAESLMLRAYGSTDKLDAMIGLLRPLGLIELVRSGRLLMARGLAET